METDTARPSVNIYLRRDIDQLWMECDGPYDMGYVCGAADRAAGETLDPGPISKLAAGNSHVLDGYRDGYRDGTW